MESHFTLERKVRVYQRPESSKWHCETRLGGKKLRKSTGETDFGKATKVAEDWYFKIRSGDVDAAPVEKIEASVSEAGHSFKDVARLFEDEYEVLTEGQRNPRYARDHSARLRNHLIPFFKNTPVEKITTGHIQDYRLMRLRSGRGKRVPSVSTMHHEIITLRHVMKTALRRGWISHLPDFSAPYGQSKKVSHRAWFSPEEYKKFYSATRARVKRLKDTRFQYGAEQMHDYILFMANTGLRPDEANRLQYRDVDIVEDTETNDTILLIEVRGKRGVGFCKSMPGAVYPFQRLRKRNQPKSTDLVFPQDHKKQFNKVLEETGLKQDKHGNTRTSYSLRHTYICLRLLEGADIYQVAKNCRTSVEMIEKHYAVHLKNTINAADINIKRRKPSKRQLAEATALNAHHDDF